MHKPSVLITGAGRGIGLALAETLSPFYDLILHASKPGNLPPLKPGQSALYADFSNNDELNAFCKILKKDHSESLYAVINNAGIALDKSLLFQPEHDIDSMIQVNLKAPILISKTALKIFNLKKEGIIINMSSCVAETGNAFQAVYAATKAALIAFSKSLAKETAYLHPEHRIRILSVSPGFIQTSMTQSIPADDQEKIKSLIPLQRFGQAEEIAETILFLISSKASYLNGSNIPVNGGLI